MLHSERFVDVSPEETYATLLDEGTYLCSTRTMYRILEAKHGGVREQRRAQLTHPAYCEPGCSPSTRTSCGRGTSRKLKGPAKWTWFYLYVILDVFSRFVARHKNSLEESKTSVRVTPAGRSLAADQISSAVGSPRLSPKTQTAELAL